MSHNSNPNLAKHKPPLTSRENKIICGSTSEILGYTINSNLSKAERVNMLVKECGWERDAAWEAVGAAHD